MSATIAEPRYDLEIRRPEESAWTITLQNVSRSAAVEAAQSVTAEGGEARWRRLDCPHPPARLYAWTAYDGTFCIACCECGHVIQGGCA